MIANGPEMRRLIAALAEVMIPRTPAMPGARDIALSEAPLDRVLKHRPDLLTLLDGLPEMGPSAVAQDYLHQLEHCQPSHYQAVLQAVLGAYYMHPEVKRRLGYEGQQALTLPRGGFGGEDLIETVMNAPPRYRDPSSGR